MSYDGPNPLVVNAGGTGSSSFTAYGPVVAASTSTGALTSVTPSATSGVPLISKGSSTLPAFGTAVVAGGGTGITTTTAYGVICGGTSSTGAFQNAGAGSSGQILQSGGASALPAYTTATYPATTTINQVLYSSAANTVAGITAGDYGVLISSSSGVPSWLANGTTGQVLTATTSGTPSWAAVSGAGAITTVDGDSGSMTPSSGTVTISGGTTGLTTSASSHTMNLTGTLIVGNGGTGIATTTAYGVIVGGTTATGAFQNAGAGTSGQLLQSGGGSAKPAYTTATYPGTTTINQILYSSASNTVGGITAADNGVLISSSSGVPSWLANSGTAGYVLTANSGAPPSWQASSGGSGITTIDGNSGSVTGSTVTITSSTTCGESVSFTGSGTTLTFATTDSNSSVCIGNGAGKSGSTATNCVALGSQALNALTSGGSNVAIGAAAGLLITSGTDNTAVGEGALGAVTTTSSSVGIGFGAGSSSTGAQNTFVGAAAGQAITSGTNNVSLGYLAGHAWTTSESSNIAIGNVGGAGQSNTIIIGTQGSGTGQQNSCTIAGIAGVSVSNLNVVTINTSTGQLGSQAAANVGTITQYDVLVGGSAGAIASVGPGSSGQVLQSGGGSANPAYSTATYPATATGTGTILRADGTNWSATTATYPTTTTTQQLLYSSSANVIAGLSTGNSLLAATNASGTLAMRAFSINVQTFTSSGSYTPTTGMLYCIIECVGGGGGGGGTATAASSTYSIGGGGGGGAYSRKFASASTIGSSQTVTIGAAGSAGSSGNNAGGSGGETSVGSICTANGGSGGSGNSGSSAAAGGAGGTAGTGDFSVPGQYGYIGYSNTSIANVGLGGDGGDSLYGYGGAQNSTSTPATGVAGQVYGGGGSGGQSFSADGAAAGGAGAKGLAVVTEYIIN